MIDWDAATREDPAVVAELRRLQVALRHDLKRDDASRELSESLRNEFCRTIVIVSAEGIDEFLKRDMDAFLRED